MSCKHPKATKHKYTGSEGTYFFCGDCWEVFGGEETKAKKKLIADATKASVTEQDEVEGNV